MRCDAIHVPKRDYLSFERTPRPEQVQEDPPEQIENLEHPALIARFGRSGQADGICDRDTGDWPTGFHRLFAGRLAWHLCSKLRSLVRLRMLSPESPTSEAAPQAGLEK